MSRKAAAAGRRPVLVVVLTAIAVSAALGIYELLVSHFGTEGRHVLATSSSITAAGIFVFAALPAWERGRPPALPQLGAAAAVLGFALVIATVWGVGGVGKPAATSITIAAMCVGVSLFALARITPRYRWLFPLASLLAIALGVLIIVSIWDGGSERATGVLAVLFAAATLSLLVLHIASRGELAAAAAPAGAARFCPSCGKGLAAGDQGRCAACGARFEVRYLGS